MTQDASGRSTPAKAGELMVSGPLDIATMRPADFSKVGINDPVAQMRMALIANADKDMALRIFSILASYPTKKPITFEQAFAAYVYEVKHPGQQLGRDFYIEPSIGLMPGYPGIEKDTVARKAGHLDVRYRVMTHEELEENEIKPGDSTAVCEIYQLDIWERMRRMGLRYQPIIGFGIVRDKEKWVTEDWVGEWPNRKKVPLKEPKPVELSGGYTWHRKARNRAYKDALRHTPGLPTDSVDLIAKFVEAHGQEALPADQSVLEKLPFERLRLMLENAEDALVALADLDSGRLEALRARMQTQAEERASDLLPEHEPEAAPVAESPVSDDELDQLRRRILAETVAHTEAPTERQRVFTDSTLQLLAPNIDERQLLLEWLLGPEHDLTRGDCEAIIAWGGIAKSGKTGELRLYGQAPAEWARVKATLEAQDDSLIDLPAEDQLPLLDAADEAADE